MRSQQFDARSHHSDGNRDTTSVKTVRSENYVDEPISDLFRTFSLQSEIETVSPEHLQRSLPEQNEDNQDWEGNWKYDNDA